MVLYQKETHRCVNLTDYSLFPKLSFILPGWYLDILVCGGEKKETECFILARGFLLGEEKH